MKPLSPVARLVDGIVSTFSPAAGFRRQAARAAAEKFGAYIGASSDRLQENWVTQGGSSDADLLPDLPRLRERSRDLTRNDAHASGAIEAFVDNVIGTGIVPQSRLDHEALGISEDQAAEFQTAAEAGFKLWAESTFADASDRLDFYGLQRVSFRSALENGDVFVHPIMVETDVRGPDSLRPFSLALELIEADRVDTPSTQGAQGIPIAESDTIRAGVELGARGQPVGYWVAKQHPSPMGPQPRENFRRIERYNAVGRPNILHLFKQKRPAQSRGEPLFASVIPLLEMKGGYMEATVVAARAQACFSAFIKKTDPTGTAAARAAASGRSGASPRERLEVLQPGVIDYLAPDEDVVFANPSTPGATFDPFIVACLREVASGIGLSYELLARDWSRTDYSSARAAILEVRRAFKCWQDLWIYRFCQPVWEMWLEEAWLLGLLPDVPFLDDPKAWSNANWVRPGFGWVDPLKEIQASQLAIQCGFTTGAEECAGQGRDVDEVYAGLAREKSLRTKLGLELAVETPKPAPPPGTPGGPKGEDADDEEEPAKREPAGATA